MGPSLTLLAPAGSKYCPITAEVFLDPAIFLLLWNVFWTSGPPLGQRPDAAPVDRRLGRLSPLRLTEAIRSIFPRDALVTRDLRKPPASGAGRSCGPDRILQSGLDPLLTAPLPDYLRVPGASIRTWNSVLPAVT